MNIPQYPTVRLTPNDYGWLRQRAELHHRKLVEEFSAIREIVDLVDASGMRVDILPHPADAQVVPVVSFQKAEE